MRKKLSIRETAVEEVDEVEFALRQHGGRIQLIRTKPAGWGSIMLEITSRDSEEITIKRINGFDPIGSGIKIDDRGRIIIEDD